MDQTVDFPPDGAVSGVLTQLYGFLAAARLPDDGRLPPERELAEILGVKRAELRKGLAVLEREGQLWRHVGKGTFVGPRPPQLLDISDLAQRSNPIQVMKARIGLEPELARLAAINATAAEVTALAELNTACRASTTWREYEAYDARFHHQIAEAAHNPIRVVVGEHVHASLLLALRYAGLGAPTTIVPADDQGAMRAEELDLADGPTLVCAQAGEVGSGASDPLEAIADAKGDAWLHVDGAFGLWAAASPRHRHLVAGAERADSWAVDAHKWLNVPYDSGLAIVADRETLRAAMGVTASYLPGSQGREPLDTVPEMSRRARSIPVYAALRSLGREGLTELIERNCALARRAAEGLAGIGAEVLNEVVLNQALVRFGDDDTTRSMLEAVQRSGEAWLGGTVWEGRAAIRVSVSNWSTTEEDIDRLVAAFAAAS